MGVVYFSIIPTFEPSRYYKCWIVCFYYTNNWDRGYYKWFSNFELMVWIAILFLGILSVFLNKKELSVIMLAVIGLTVFELLFEPRARYLYTYAPFYIILAVSGIQMIIKRNQYYYQWKEKL